MMARLKRLRLILSALLLMLGAAGSVHSQTEPLIITCNGSPIDDWPAQLSLLDDRVLCRASGFDIRIEVTGINRLRSPMTGDGTHIITTFRRYQDASDTVQPVTMHVAEFSSNVLEYYLRDGDGDRITTLHRQFVWTRDFTPRMPHRRRDTVVAYGASQSFRCGHASVDGSPGAPAHCMAARTVVVCDSFHDIRPGVRGQVRYPVLTAQSYGLEASVAMLNGFEQIAQVLETMQTEILTHTCTD